MPDSKGFDESDFISLPFLSGDDGGVVEFARLPTTVREYAEFMSAGGYSTQDYWSNRGWAWRTQNKISKPKYWGKPRYRDALNAVTGVSFWEAEAYARFRGCSLPTESEWYLAATNGSKTANPWGNEPLSETSATGSRAHLSFFGRFAVAAPASVMQSAASASEAGLRDLIGNTAEWVYPGAHPQLEAALAFGMLRGGSWWNSPFGTDPAFRDVVPLTVRDNQTGIRLVRRCGNVPTLKPVAPPSVIIRSYGRPIARPTKPFRQEGIPDLAASEWRLKISGDMIAPREFTLEDLKNFAVHNDGGLFVCVCRWAERNEFRGVLVSDLLDACGLPRSGDKKLYLRQRSAPGKKGRVYETSVSVESARNNRAILAYAMDGKELTRELGWPLRYIDFHLYGYKGVKCLTELVVTDQFRKGWWEEACHYDLHGEIKPGTVTVVGKDAKRFEIQKGGRVKNIPPGL